MRMIMLTDILILLGVVLVLYLLAIMPKLRKNKDCKRMDGWLYAHRGLHDNQSEAPENSLKAFALAVEHGYGIELDVQLTKDLVPVILHDYSLKRACNADGMVKDMTYAELQKFQLFRSRERIPSLQEALAVIGGKVPLIIELKIPWKADQLCRIVAEQLKDYQGFYVIQSFNPFGLMWYRKYHPEVVRGQLATDFVKEKIEGSRVQYFILKHLLFNFITKPDYIAYHHVYKKALSFTLCRKLYRTKPVAWTIQSQKELEDSKGYYQVFIFDSFRPQKQGE